MPKTHADRIFDRETQAMIGGPSIKPNEPTLYRKFADAQEIKNPPDGAVMCWVVPVERCKHGNYARHMTEPSIFYNERTELMDYEVQWCPGPGIGGDDA